MAAEEAAGGRRRRRRKKKSRTEERIEFRGVQRRPSGKCGARIRDSSAQRWLGTFDTAEEAARAFDAAAVRLHGPAAETNFEQIPSSGADDAGVAVHRLSSSVKKKARPYAGTEFRGVYRGSSGSYGAHIRDSKGRGSAQRWLGTFDSAEDPARAFDATSVRLCGGAAETNFVQTLMSSADHAVHLLSSPLKKKARPEDRIEFRGVYRRRSGRYGAHIKDSRSKGKAERWLGTFDTAEEAARAFDAAAVELRGPAAKTNFKQPPTAVAADYGEEWHMDLLIDFLELSALDFRSDSIIPGVQHGDLKAGLTPAEWHQVDELLKDIEPTDDREALIEAAAVLHQISLAGMEMVGEPNLVNDDHSATANW
ncbi:unnamed protein product [Alopecurus aequalis]